MEELPIQIVMRNVREKLEVGESYKYTNLCRLIGVELKLGGRNVKIHLEKYLSRLFEYEKIDKKYKIISIYDYVQDPIPRKTRKDAIFTEYMRYVILHDLSLGETDFILTTKQLWLKFNMINHTCYNYLVKKSIKMFEVIESGAYDEDEDSAKMNQMIKEMNEELRQEFKDIDIKTLNSFMNRVSKKLNRMLYEAFNRLIDAKYITKTKTYMVGNSGNDLRESTDEEDLFIRRCEENAYIKCGISTFYQVTQLSLKRRIKFYGLLREFERDMLDLKIIYRATRIKFEKRTYKEQSLVKSKIGRASCRERV